MISRKKNFIKAITYISKSKVQIYRTPRTIQNRSFLIKWQNQKLKPMNNNCHIPDFEHTFSFFSENGGLNLNL